MRTYNKSNTQNVKQARKQSKAQTCCTDVVGDIGEIVLCDPPSILKYKVKIEDGGSWWWEESNLELIEDVKPNQNLRKAIRFWVLKD